MSLTSLVVISELVTFVVSILVSVFVAGRSWGEIKRDVETVKRDLAEIKGMFIVKLRDEHVDR